MATIQHLINRVCAEYLEMPGLRLTAAQVQRLCGIERTACALVLGALVTSNFLWMATDGHYARVTDGPWVRTPASHADLRIGTRSLKAS